MALLSFADSAPRAYRLKVGNAYLTFSTSTGASPAQLLEVPEEPISGIPINGQLPGRYLPLFSEGCRDAIAYAAPVRLSGAVVDFGQVELYRAAFMPLAMRQNSSMHLVFSKFNRRTGRLCPSDTTPTTRAG